MPYLIRAMISYLRAIRASGVHLFSSLHGHHFAVGQYQQLGGSGVVALPVRCGIVGPKVSPPKRLLIFLLHSTDVNFDITSDTGGTQYECAKREIRNQRVTMPAIDPALLNVSAYIHQHLQPRVHRLTLTTTALWDRRVNRPLTCSSAKA